MTAVTVILNAPEKSAKVTASGEIRVSSFYCLEDEIFVIIKRRRRVSTVELKNAQQMM